MTLRFLKCLVLVALVHVLGAAMVFGAYHFVKAGEGLAEKDQPDTAPKTIVDQTQAPKTKGTVEIRVKRHTVKSGESYWSIAQQYDTTIKQLMTENGHKPGHTLRPGEELVIPSND